MESNEKPSDQKFFFTIKKSKTNNLAQKKPHQKEFINSINNGGIIAVQNKRKTEELVIPLPASSGSYRQKSRFIQNKELTDEPTPIPDSTILSLNDRAVSEILEGIKPKNSTEHQTNITIPSTSSGMNHEVKESSLTDYEAVPISGFGMAMLRGMGLKEEKTTIRDEKPNMYKFRPKGLGLGADASVNPVELKIPVPFGQTLILKKGAFILVLGGHFKEFYGTIEGIDEDSGTVIVILALNKKRIVLSEKFVQLVTEKEYNEYKNIPVKTIKNSKKIMNTYGLVKPTIKEKSCDKYNSDKSNDVPRKSREREHIISHKSRLELDKKYYRPKGESSSSPDPSRSRKNHHLLANNSNTKDYYHSKYRKDEKKRSSRKYRSRSR